MLRKQVLSVLLSRGSAGEALQERNATRKIQQRPRVGELSVICKKKLFCNQAILGRGFLINLDITCGKILRNTIMKEIVLQNSTQTSTYTCEFFSVFNLTTLFLYLTDTLLHYLPHVLRFSTNISKWSPKIIVIPYSNIVIPQVNSGVWVSDLSIYCQRKYSP